MGKNKEKRAANQYAAAYKKLRQQKAKFLKRKHQQNKKLQKRKLKNKKLQNKNLQSKNLQSKNLQNKNLQNKERQRKRQRTSLQQENGCYLKCKRTADLVLSGAAVFFLSPLLLGISIAIKLDSKGPVIFRQTRVGIHNSHFEIYKFRTMYADTPKDMPTHLLKNPDAMVTRTGAFLRKYSLDELPQLFNILRGEMSIVGPRPALWNQYDLVAERKKYGANDVMPGLTGWAQINGRDELEIPVKAKLDGEYVKKFGLWMDLRCIVGTAFAVAGHKGVVEGGTGTMEMEKKENAQPAGGAAAAQAVYAQVKDSLSGGQKKVLITGAGSYIGTAVKEWLSAFGGSYQVEELDMHGDQWKMHDFSGYDTVFHVAGIAHADTGSVSNEQKQLYYEVNRDLALETAKKAKSAGVGQFIYMSSIIVYGESVSPFEERRRITAMTRPQPANFYGNSKWQADKALREMETAGFKVCVLRPPMIYGAGSKGNYPVLAKLAAITPIFPQVKNERSVLYIDHLCEFVRLMIENEETGVFFPQDAGYADTAGIVCMIAQAHGKKVRLLKALVPCVRLASVLPGRFGRLAGKAFGSFSYEMSLSEYPKGNYRIHSLKESILITEGGRADS
ncbi:MAG: sugar transferase [Eubacterium sp.]|nr:sugar transferase [Eubacterium sp.]